MLRATDEGGSAMCPRELWIYPYAENSDVYRIEGVDGDQVQLRRPRARKDATRSVSVTDLLIDGRRCVIAITRLTASGS